MSEPWDWDVEEALPQSDRLRILTPEEYEPAGFHRPAGGPSAQGNNGVRHEWHLLKAISGFRNRQNRLCA
jgi:hypothetical protein